jgi:FtsP/CotA-like multicopper oxidase with cupredoxin domain
MLSRRRLLGAGAMLMGATAISGRVQAAGIPEAPTTATNTMQPPLFPSSGPDYQPVVTLNGWTLPWRVNGDWKEFHLVAEPVLREFAPGMNAHLWGYNGQSPGPTIEAVEGDKVRIFVTNKLPEHTTVHWHGVLVPNGMDGVGGVTQPHIDPGKTFVYEFELKRSGSLAFGRDGADGYGHDGDVRRPSARSQAPPGRPRLCVRDEFVPHRSGHLCAEGR